ncbi:ketopantoate reductase family protein [Companilactobacillus kedongensis]|uniref:ketopantoate reductase family protein n=1 Tax=Companilactobacillus kedongensis TaxID=2486004 RepID=UPI000F78F8AF|nr:ketopantoate reductase family protein [Companilactobacillus kedongensis]
MKYAVLGAGAMGLRYGVLLQEAGFPVDFVDIWDKQIETVTKQNGVFVSRDGENKHLVPINISSPEDYSGDPDVWIVFVKQMQLEDALKRAGHLFTKQQYVVAPMNGMGHIEKLDQYFAEDKVISGTAMIATVLNGPGDVDFMGPSGAGSMKLVNQNETPDEMTQQIADDFTKANLNPEITTNFQGTLMAKVILNSVCNTLCTMFGIKMGEFIQAPTTEALSKQLINEAFDVCERAGITLLNTREQEWEAIQVASTKGMPLHYPSMYQDMSKHRPTEVDYINGYIYELGLKYHYEATTHDYLRNLVHLAEFTNDFDPDSLVAKV